MFEVIGHRGSGTLLPENTIEGFKLAFELGCPRIELDVQLTLDEHAAVIHNPALDPTTDGTGFVKDYRMEQLKEYDAGGGRKIPDLPDVLEMFQATDLQFQIELKGEGTENVVPNIVEKLCLSSRVRYTSFFHARVKDACRGNKSEGGLLMSASPIDPVGLLSQAEVGFLHLNSHNITEDMVKLLHANDKKIIAWDSIVDDKTFSRLLDMEVDGATTDRPDLFLNFLKVVKTVR